jgi:hypothetical protein
LNDEAAFNKAYKDFTVGSEKVIIQRECKDCTSAPHKNIFYKRIRSPATLTNPWKTFKEAWEEAGNKFNTDFKLYGSLKDALTDTNPWKSCNFHDTVGFPRDCSPGTTMIGSQWNAKSNGVNDYQYTIYDISENKEIKLGRQLQSSEGDEKVHGATAATDGKSSTFSATKSGKDQYWRTQFGESEYRYEVSKVMIQNRPGAAADAAQLWGAKVFCNSSTYCGEIPKNVNAGQWTQINCPAGNKSMNIIIVTEKASVLALSQVKVFSSKTPERVTTESQCSSTKWLNAQQCSRDCEAKYGFTPATSKES